MISILTVLSVLTLQSDPPPPPVLPGRPPPLADGEAFGGVLGSSCDDLQDDDGRWYNDHVLSLAQGQRQTIIVSSPDFAPVLQIMDREDRIVAEIQGQGDGRVVGLYFSAAGQPSPQFLPPVIYRLRVTSVAPGGVGRWKIEKSHSGRLAPFASHDFPVRTGCRPIGPTLPG